MTALTPTPEQDDCIGLFLTGDQLVIEAGAGTGKTSTLELISRHTQRLGTYVAFNRAIVREAELRFPMTVTSVTAHGLAMRAIGKRYSHRLPTVRTASHRLGRWLDIGPVVVRYDDKDKRLQPGYLASLVMKGIARWCASADPEPPDPRYIPFVHGIDTVDAEGHRKSHNNDELRRYLAPKLIDAWADLCDPDGRLPFTHDHYLKMWQLSGPTIPGDYVLFDEAQDATPVMLDAVATQAQRGAQLVFVGDSCQPTGTLVERVIRRAAGRGHPAVVEQVPIEQLEVGDIVTSYDIAKRHLRRTGSPITGISSRPFHGDLVAVKAGELASRYTPDHRCVVKIGDGLDGKHLVYLMRSGVSFRVGRAAARYGAGFGPMLRAQAEGADALWLLSAHDTAEEAAIVEARISARFGVPMMLFRAAGNRLMSQQGLDDFWSWMGDLRDNANAALAACGRSIHYPLWSRGGDRLLVRRPRVMYAVNVMTGMKMRTRDGDWLPVTTSRERYDGLVWSMDVERDETYVADSLVTHNCQQIYEWRGAVNALATLEGHRAFLTQSWRFGPAIADVANLVLEELDAEIRLVGNPALGSTVGACDPGAILARSNVGAIDTVLRLQRAGRHPHLVGGGEEVVRFAKAVQELQETGSTYHPELACFESWAEVLAYVEQDPQGDELALMVHLLTEYGLQIILDALDGMIAENQADVIVSTAHKAKGREWSAVRLCSDFPEPDERGAGSDGELRLLYVAATRARDALDLRMCEPLQARLQALGAAR